MKLMADYGTWRSELTGEFVAGGHRLGEPCWGDGRLYWLATRPAEQGRVTLMCRTADGSIHELLPAPWSARSKVHEYGGGSFCAAADRVYFVNGADQQIYDLDVADGSIRRVTDTGLWRYADLQFDAARQRLLAICEDHTTGGEPANRLVAVDLKTGAVKALETAFDFVSSPRLSPDGRWLAYLTWNHPNMPWDGTQLWVRPVNTAGVAGAATLVAGGDEESVTQPQWSPAGDLFYVSDRTGWWNLYRWRGENHESIIPLDAEFAAPQWVFGQAHYGFLAADHLLVSFSQNGAWQIAALHYKNGTWQLQALPLDCCSVDHIACEAGRAAVLGAGAYRLQTLWLTDGAQSTPVVEQTTSPLQKEDISIAKAIVFPSGEATAFAFFYPPANAGFQGPAGQLPPLIVMGHGGPTSAADPSLNRKIQFWTHRGFAVLDVNYRGSAGYGRPYRNALRAAWGSADVQDMCAAAEYATAQGWVHPQQRFIRGSSAGGYTVLCALTGGTTFDAGVSLYGIGDLEALLHETHKFEARYLDSLVGPYPAAKHLYRERSPLYRAEAIRCPLLVFQGLEDKVVPPGQAEELVTAARRAGASVTYVTYRDEGHGFRRAHNIQHQLDTELAFYQRLLNPGPAAAGSVSESVS